MIFPPCQPSLPGHCTVCKTCNCKTNIFFHCPSEPHGPSGRPALQAKPFYFSTPTASIQQSEVFHFHQRDCRERLREQSVLSSSGKVTEPPATHSLLMPTRGHSLLPESAGCIPPQNTGLLHSHLSYRSNECVHLLLPKPSPMWDQGDLSFLDYKMGTFYTTLFSSPPQSYLLMALPSPESMILWIHLEGISRPIPRVTQLRLRSAVGSLQRWQW